MLVVCAEKFSDKIGSVRPSRMIFGDGASALVVGPAADGAPPDIEVVQTYASGPVSQVNSIIWPNPEFDNNLTVYGPEVKALVERYLDQMMGELRALRCPGRRLAARRHRPRGPAPGQQVDGRQVGDRGRSRRRATSTSTSRRSGNVSAASIPIAIHDAVREGAIDRPMRVFTPAFGAGAVGGYTVIRVDPAIVVPEGAQEAELLTAPAERRGIAGGRPRRVRRLRRPCRHAVHAPASSRGLFCGKLTLAAGLLVEQYLVHLH